MNYYINGLTHFDDAKRVAVQDFATAVFLVENGKVGAAEYALAWHEYYKPNHWKNANRDKRNRVVRDFATDALTCAKKITDDGRAFYEKEGGLVVCTLLADAVAGPQGYMLW